MSIESALSNLVDAWLMPLPLAVVLSGLGCLALWLRRPRGGRVLVSIAWLLLTLVSCTAIADLLLLPLEERYPKWDGRGADLAFVVVMGAGQQEAPRLPETNRPNTAGVYRLLEAIAIYRANPGSKLIFSGAGGEPQPVAEVSARVAQAIGVDAADVVLQPRGHNTEQEVKLLAPLVGRQRFAVVTSAAHMPRTMELFAAAGLQPIPAPTHFLDRFNPHPSWRDVVAPNSDNLARAQFALHEYIGMAWLKLKALLS